MINKIFEKVKKMDLRTLNKIVDTVFPQVSTSFSLTEIASLVSAGLTYELGDNTGFPFDKDDSKRYQSAGSVVIALGLAENVRDLHKFLFPLRKTIWYRRRCREFLIIFPILQAW